jgi:S-adenosylmethionine/arginine decarboxylase-like enzyme
MTDHFLPIHKIFVLDAELESLIDESNPQEFCKNYFTELLEAVGMKPLAPMSCSPAADPRAPGFSGVQELTTSHTSLHYFWEPHAATKNPNLHLDLYSCGPFAYEDVIRVAHKHFGLGEWTGNFIERQLNPLDRISLQIIGKGDLVQESVAMSPRKGEKKTTVL